MWALMIMRFPLVCVCVIVVRVVQDTSDVVVAYSECLFKHSCMLSDVGSPTFPFPVLPRSRWVSVSSGFSTYRTPVSGRTTRPRSEVILISMHVGGVSEAWTDLPHCTRVRTADQSAVD